MGVPRGLSLGVDVADILYVFCELFCTGGRLLRPMVVGREGLGCG
jgi:hypothetical protein